MYTVRNPKAFDDMPELGMGFHFGSMRLTESKDAFVEGVIVLNSQFGLTASEILDVGIVNGLVKTRMQDRMLSLRDIGDSTDRLAPPLFPARSISPSDDVALFKSSFGHLISNMNSYETRAKMHASPAFPLRPNSPERFVRFSAYANDRRVRPDGGLLPGTYVTSERDAGHAPSGFAVVGRYALPNPISATNRFDITVAGEASGLVGTVLPAFGQAGGGVEIELTNGAPPGSVKGPTTIPEY